MASVQDDGDNLGTLNEVLALKSRFFRELVPNQCETRRRLVPLGAWWKCVEGFVRSGTGNARWKTDLAPIISKYITNIGSEQYVRLWNLFTAMEEQQRKSMGESGTYYPKSNVDKIMCIKLLARVLQLKRRRCLSDTLYTLYRHMSLARECQWDAFSKEAEVYWVQRGKRRESELVDILRFQEEELQKTRDAFLMLYRKQEKSFSRDPVTVDLSAADDVQEDDLSSYVETTSDSTGTEPGIKYREEKRPKLAGAVSVLLTFDKARLRQVGSAFQFFKRSSSEAMAYKLLSFTMSRWYIHTEKQRLREAMQLWRRSLLPRPRILSAALPHHHQYSSSTTFFDRPVGSVPCITTQQSRPSRRYVPARAEPQQQQQQQQQQSLYTEFARSLSPLPKTRARLLQNARVEPPSIHTLPFIESFQNTRKVSSAAPLFDAHRQATARSQSPLLHRPQIVFRTTLAPSPR